MLLLHVVLAENTNALATVIWLRLWAVVVYQINIVTKFQKEIMMDDIEQQTTSIWNSFLTNREDMTEESKGMK
jgi:hypothetical protein